MTFLRRHTQALLLLLLAVTYATTASRFALGGDGGEFAALAAVGGVAHPPGYPLFVLFLRALAWMPLSEAAHRASVATSLLGVLSAWLLYRTARSYGASPRSSALVTVLYAASPLAWKLATYPEVFPGNVCIALAIAWVASPDPPPLAGRGLRRAAALGLLAGLGLAHHHSILMVAPVGLCGFFVAARESRRAPIAVLLALLALLIGLLPYGYDVLAARGVLGNRPVLWGDTSTWAGLVHHVLRRDYGTTSLGTQRHDRETFAQLTYLCATLSRSFLALPLVLVGALFAARPRVVGGEPALRRARIMLLASVILAGPLFVSLFNVPPRALGLLILERFHLLPAALGLVFVAPAFDVMFASMRTRLAALVMALVGMAQAAQALPVVLDDHNGAVQHYAENVLAIAEPNAIVVGSGDHRAGSFLYASARGIRPDVLFIQPWLILSEPYRLRTSAALGISLPAPVNRVVDANALLHQLLATGRPVYLTDWPAAGMEGNFPSYPLGPLLRLVATPTDVPPPLEILAANEKAMPQLLLEDAAPRRGTWGGAFYSDYARPWWFLAREFRAAGAVQLAEPCEARARILTPAE